MVGLQTSSFALGMVGEQCHLMACDPGSTAIRSAILLLTTRNKVVKLTGQADFTETAGGITTDTPAHVLLSYFYLIFDKFAGKAAMGNVVSPTTVHFMLPDSADAELREGLLEYGEISAVHILLSDCKYELHANRCLCSFEG